MVTPRTEENRGHQRTEGKDAASLFDVGNTNAFRKKSPARAKARLKTCDFLIPVERYAL